MGIDDAHMQERTLYGGVLSILAVVSIIILFFLEVQWFQKIDRRDEVIIDQARGPPNVTVEMNITLHRVPCAMAYLNFLDNRLSNSLGVDHEIIKTRIISFSKMKKVHFTVINI